MVNPYYTNPMATRLLVEERMKAIHAQAGAYRPPRRPGQSLFQGLFQSLFQGLFRQAAVAAQPAPCDHPCDPVVKAP